jgi:membrane-bound serine protease (ClpP class)
MMMTRAPRHGVVRFILSVLPWAGCVAALVSSGLSTCGADEAAAASAVLVPVRLPIVGTRDTQVQGAILRQLDRLRGRRERGILVLQFVPGDDGDPTASDFGRALELARFLTDGRLAGIKTVAFLPEGVAGHAVLPVLACEEIVMPATAVLGPAHTADATIDGPVRVAYEEIADRRRTVPGPVARSLVDPAVRVARVATDSGEQFVELDQIAALRTRAAVLNVEELQPSPLALPGRRARELGFVRLLAATPAEVARGLGLPEASLAADPALDGGWRPLQVVLSGAITGEAVARLRGRLDRAVTEGTNLICLRIDSAGGAPDQALVLATWLASLDPAQVRTVAYVPREARGDAALVAAACDELVMHPGAVLGGEGNAAIGGREGESIAAAWRAGVARPRERSWSLPVALAVPGIVVRRAVERESGRVAFFSDAELDARADREAWQVGGELGVGPLMLDGGKAESLGLANHVVTSFDGLRAAYGIDADVPMPQPGWADELLAALASPSLAWLLLLIGGAGLYIELKTPGFGFGGFVAMVAFIVYFWSQYLQGTAGWLEVMLFLAGLVCVAAEILVLPGFGVLGLGGGLLVIASLVLASQSFVLPANDYQIRQMQWSLLGILGAITGVAALGIAVRHWLPSTPMFRHVLLAPPTEEPAEDLEDPLEDLVGLEGTATSRLAPAGRAWIGDVVHEVFADGELVEPGATVRVVAVRNGRITVRQV